MEAADRALFERSLRGAVEAHHGAALDEALRELGWADALAAEPRTAVSLLFGLQGEAHATSSALVEVVRSALEGVEGTIGMVLPALGETAPPGVVADGRLTLAGLLLGGRAGGDRVLVVARGDSGDRALLVPTHELVVRPVAGIDPDLDLVEVSAEAVAVKTAGGDLADGAWAAAAARAQVALGHELVGASRRMLALAREHALERVQFGQPIARFQAVRHRLAETLIAIETAEAALDAAWLDGTAGPAAMAKALAGRGARTAARHCQQVLAGFGFTTEHDLHLYIRRMLVLDELFGSARGLTRELGQDLLDSRRLPLLLPL